MSHEEEKSLEPLPQVDLDYIDASPTDKDLQSTQEVDQNQVTIGTPREFCNTSSLPENSVCIVNADANTDTSVKHQASVNLIEGEATNKKEITVYTETIDSVDANTSEQEITAVTKEEKEEEEEEEGKKEEKKEEKEEEEKDTKEERNTLESLVQDAEEDGENAVPLSLSCEEKDSIESDYVIVTSPENTSSGSVADIDPRRFEESAVIIDVDVTSEPAQGSIATPVIHKEDVVTNSTSASKTFYLQGDDEDNETIQNRDHCDDPELSPGKTVKPSRVEAITPQATASNKKENRANDDLVQLNSDDNDRYVKSFPGHPSSEKYDGAMNTHAGKVHDEVCISQSVDNATTQCADLPMTEDFSVQPSASYLPVDKGGRRSLQVTSSAASKPYRDQGKQNNLSTLSQKPSTEYKEEEEEEKEEKPVRFIHGACSELDLIKDIKLQNMSPRMNSIETTGEESQKGGNKPRASVSHSIHSSPDGSNSNGVSDGETLNDQVEAYAPFTAYVDIGHIPFEILPTSVNNKRAYDMRDGKEESLSLCLKRYNFKTMKNILRSNFWSHRHEIRSRLWQDVCRCVHNTKGDVYSEMEDTLFNRRGSRREITLPSFVDFKHLPNHYLNTNGIETVHKILRILEHTNPDIVYSPTLYAHIVLFLHYMQPSDVYNCAYALLRAKESYIPQTKLASEASKKVLKDLTKKFAKSSYQVLLKSCDSIDAIFDDWIWWIFVDLPFPYLVRLIDSFLVEGLKVLYRAALAIIMLFTKDLSKKTKKTSKKRESSEVVKEIKEFCQEIPVRIDKFLKKGFNIRGLTRKEIRKLQVNHEMGLKSNNRAIARSSSSSSFRGNNSAGARMNTSPNLVLMHVDSHTISTDMFSRPRSRSMGWLAFPDFHSVAISMDDLYIVYSWLPTRFSVQQPELLYTSEEHGTSLMTLYTRIEDWEPTLIVIKTTSGEVFGAFCSTFWRERRNKISANLSYFGTGETFIFTLYPEQKKYEWVGLRNSNYPATASMFQAGDNSILTVGGGNGEAIQLDANLEHCRTEHCDTFENEPLCPSGDFTCKVVEVYGFN